MTVVAFRMHDGAGRRLLALQFGEDAHRRHQPEVMTDTDHDPGASTGIERGLRIGLAERERFFAIDMLASSRDRFNLRTMLCVRRRKDHRLDRFDRPDTSSSDVASAI